MSFTRPFLLGPVFFLTAPSHAQVVIKWRGEGCRYMMPLRYKRAQLLKIKAQLSSLWAKGCILMIVCVCVLSDLT